MRRAVPKKLQFEKCDPLGIPLRELIAVHRQFRPGMRLAGNLGDGFLCAQNPVFRNIRQECLRRGFSFTNRESGPYYAFPLMSLDAVIEARRIPYRDNFVWLEILEKQVPGKFTLTELKRSELQFNYVFHESAHCIAHAVFFGRARFSRLPKNADTLLRILLGEAFANMVECLSAVFAEGEIGGYFLDGNCHFRANVKEAKELRRAVKKWGLEKTGRVLLAAFLYANYLVDRLGRKELARIREFAGLEKSAEITALAKIGTELSEQFRTTTTHLHLIKMGFPSALGVMMRGDPLLRLEKNAGLRAKALELAAIAARA